MLPEVAEDARSTGPSSRVGARCPDCSRWGMRPVGYVRGGRQHGSDCQRPLRVVCRFPECGHVEFWACRSSSERRCPPCADRTRRHYARVIETGLTDAPGHAYFLTLTAPGDAPHRQWVQGQVRHRPACSCWDHGLTMGQWNRQESACWNRLRTALVRLVGTLAYAGAVEVQERGALHRHVVLRTPTPLTPAEVQGLALAAGYGCVLDLQQIGSAAGMGRYLSKYVTKGDDRENAPWEAVKVNTATGEITLSTSPTYRVRSQSQTWGCTMRDVRSIASAQARARARYLRELEDLLEHPNSRPALGSAPESTNSDPP
jgi:hypothetical protein